MAFRTPRAPLGRQAFTLVEMLVVIGIVVLLASVLLPTLGAARRASVNTKCLNNLREIGMAMSQYLRDYDNNIPVAVSSNTWDDPGSPLGAYLRPPPYQPPDYFQWTPVALPVAYYLDPYLRYDLRPWQCPGTKVVHSEPQRIFRAQEVLRSDLIHTKDDRRMWGTTGQWRPGYMFVSTLDWGWFYKYDHHTWVEFAMADWVSRSVAGLRLSEVKTVTLQPSSEIVLFYDYNSAFHSKSGDDVYVQKQVSYDLTRVPADRINRGKFQSNFLYLDGHVETRHYTWQGGLLNQIHKPIARGGDGGAPAIRQFPD